MVSGVVQGSVLGPLPLLVYISHLPEAAQGHIKMFADDTSYTLLFPLLVMSSLCKMIWLPLLFKLLARPHHEFGVLFGDCSQDRLKATWKGAGTRISKHRSTCGSGYP